MCSFIGQVFYGGCMVAALGLTLGSMFTPEWRKITETNNGQADGTTGLFDFNCKLNNIQDCAQPFNIKPTWEKVVIISLIVAIVLEVIAVAWSVLTLFACCCRRHILHPLSGFSLLAAIALIVSLAFFYSHYREEIGNQNWDVSSVSQLRGKTNLGYSFFLGCAALGANIIAIIIGALTSCLGSPK